MNKNIKIISITIIAIIALLFFYRTLFIRTVNYEIGGIKIPSKYNVLTGKVKPIIDYRGKELSRTVEARGAGKIGLSEEEVVVAQLRWAVFEEWVKAHPEYNGWQDDALIFKKAHDAFRKELEAKGLRFRIIK